MFADVKAWSRWPVEFERTIREFWHKRAYSTWDERVAQFQTYSFGNWDVPIYDPPTMERFGWKKITYKS
jgi:hypothetical protein